MENSFDVPVAPKRGPEPTEIETELPNASVEAVEEAKAFAAATVRPEPVEETLTKRDRSVPLEQAVLANRSKMATDAEGDIHAHDIVTGETVTVPAVEEVFPLKAVDLLDSATLLKVSTNAEIAEALAKEGLVIDQDEVNRALEEGKHRAALEVILAPSASVADLDKAFTDVETSEDLAPVTPESINEMKYGINSSFEEVASLLLEHQRQIDDIESRLAEHNKRGGHKI